ncbi:hypothetical protein B0H13DRAFT_1913416 [Mycena leptocephala]|nr:hypothetical protein B0H13DRAFT_1913416 [Mycena leptocephala]
MRPSLPQTKPNAAGQPAIMLRLVACRELQARRKYVLCVDVEVVYVVALYRQRVEASRSGEQRGLLTARLFERSVHAVAGEQGTEGYYSGHQKLINAYCPTPVKEKIQAGSSMHRTRIIMETNGLFWATSIMTSTLIQHFIDDAMHAPPCDPRGPFCPRRPTAVKFINNGSGVPLPLPKNETVRIVAEFLSVTQHIEFYKTKEMLYLSRLHGKFSVASTLISTHLIEGSTKLFTDPQIMTAPSIGEGVEILGDGNVPAAFNAFPEHFHYNGFCGWFEFPR